MKNKKTHIFILVAFLFFISGIMLTTIGIAKGGQVYLKQTHFGPISTISWVGEERTLESKTFSSNKTITSIEVDASIGEVVLVGSDTFKIEVENFNLNLISYKEHNGKITLQAKSDNIIVLPWDWFNSDTYHKKITVYVPASCTNLSVGADLGNVEAKDLTLDTFSAQLNLGNLSAENMDIKNGELNLDLGHGAFQGNFREKLIIKNDLGDVAVRLADGRKDYDYHLKTDLGSIQFDSQTFHKHTEQNNANRLLQVKVNLGSIEIQFHQ